MPNLPPDEDAAARAALSRYDGLEDAALSPFGAGLINRTFLVEKAGARHVLQRVNPIFAPAIHHNIRAVTERLAARGMVTPRLVRARDGALFVEADGGVFRLMTCIDGASFDVIQSAAHARSAGHLVARFHAALDGIDHAWVGLRAGVHDTPRHLATLRDAIAVAPGHRLAPAVLPLAEAILDDAAALPPLPDLPPRPCHGDLKINNLLSEGAAPPASERAVCLVDLDTVGPMPLAFELGDAWRSWCNPRGEDDEHAVFDLPTFAASLEGYVDGLGRPLTTDERRALLHGVEWISLELAARFCADAIHERYFGWTPARFAGRGEHNLVRARGQHALHRAALATRSRRAALLGLA